MTENVIDEVESALAEKKHETLTSVAHAVGRSKQALSGALKRAGHKLRPEMKLIKLGGAKNG